MISSIFDYCAWRSELILNYAIDDGACFPDEKWFSWLEILVEFGVVWAEYEGSAVLSRRVSSPLMDQTFFVVRLHMSCRKKA